MKTEILKQIEAQVPCIAEYSEKENRIYVKLYGVREAYTVKHFMEKNGYQDVYGTYNDGEYTLGFKGENI